MNVYIHTHHTREDGSRDAFLTEKTRQDEAGNFVWFLGRWYKIYRTGGRAWIRSKGERFELSPA